MALRVSLDEKCGSVVEEPHLQQVPIEQRIYEFRLN
jgi:hypothetical protein